ncbi:FAD-binding domain-containing protein [Mycena indigotica]|uniref:FAD-binding domain-containing protein n=1 Tax=Mycena indigotica TaxID=2126181 RepID=A0A8H6VXA3_9AGAR|nr:FAD-binding domain-containing protein [Mycena indigotica]KAF7297479.1 FAD-binding domain-containing protein [Mycena indigotica]
MAPMSFRSLALVALSTLVFAQASDVESSAASGQRANALAACAALNKSLGSTLVQTSSGPEYDFSVHNAWNFQNTLFNPTCIVFPRQTSHVQTAMKAIFKAKAHYAVQAGSHSAMKGWNNVQDGVLILFSHMQSVVYDKPSHSVTFEPGIHWGNATSQLSQYGVAVVGGRVGDVGTGLLLGGGISFLSPSQGFAADNFLSLDVVLVDGTVVTATATNRYSDLFTALKGGANRFGIVTKYTVRAVDVGTPDDTPFYGGHILYNSSYAAALSKATAKYTRETTDPKAALLFTITTTLIDGVAEQVCVLFLFYRGSSLPQSIYGDFLAIPAVDTVLSPLSWTQILPARDPPNFVSSNRGFVQHFSASAVVPEDRLVLSALNHFQNFSSAFLHNGTTSGMNTTSFILTPILASQIAAGKAKGGNSMIAPGLKGPYLNVQRSEQFDAGVPDIPAFVQDGMNLYIKQVPRSPGLPLFMNECDQGQNVYETYGNFDALKATYKKYDPTRFNMQYTQGPMGL